MENRRGSLALLACAALVVMSLLTSACAAPVGEAAQSTTAPAAAALSQTPQEPETTFALPDITTRRITRDDLSAMLPLGEGTELSRTNEDLVTGATLDREDEASDIVLYGRSTGIGFAYAGAPQRYVWIDVLPDADAASSYLDDAAGDIAKGVGGTHAPDVAVDGATGFAIEAGSEAIGIIATLADGSGIETMVLGRAGRLVFFASQVDTDPATDARVAVQYLADDTIAGIVSTLTEADIDRSVTDLPRYRFETVTTISTEAGRTIVTARGILDGDARSCTITTQAPASDTVDEIVDIAGLVWWRREPARFERVGPSNLAVAGLLTRCPGWPLHADAAGVAELMQLQDAPARHHVNGVDAAGYQSDAAGLASVLAMPALQSIVEAFSFWVADDSPWIVELAVSMSGPADELRLLAGPGVDASGEGTLTIRHRVFDLGTVEQSVVPPG